LSVVPQMKGGCTTPAQLRRTADVADRYAMPLARSAGRRKDER
jgi:nitrite reductase (NADH) large subunit